MLTLLSVLVGVTGFNLFQGYQTDTLGSLADSAVYGEALGHLVLMKEGASLRGKVQEAAYMFTGADLAVVRDALAGFREVDFGAPRLLLEGLITDGRASLVFFGLGMEPATYRRFRARFGYAGEGQELTPERPRGGQVARDLAAILDLDVGGGATLFSSTLAGRLNAVDMDVIGVFDTGSAATNDKFVVVPLGLARDLYGTDGAHQVAVVLADPADAPRVGPAIADALRRRGVPVEVRDWESMSAFFRGVRQLYGMIFGFLFLIVATVVVMSVLNTMTMAVMERAREIGTLRALGMRPGAVQRLFAAEGLVLGLAGAAGATVTTLLVGGLINAARITYRPPGISAEVPLYVALDPGEMVGTGVGVAVLCGLVSLVPARRTARLEVVDALRHV
ncbi:MAG: ABC transporter permease [Candidatus Rokuibacteriota bacterium]